jgi:hypothetical protein
MSRQRLPSIDATLSQALRPSDGASHAAQRARCITPAQSIPDDEDDPADYPPVINPGNAMRQREKRFDPAHLRLREQKQIMHGGASSRRQ